jgi:hypothetical protein
MGPYWLSARDSCLISIRQSLLSPSVDLVCQLACWKTYGLAKLERLHSKLVLLQSSLKDCLEPTKFWWGRKHLLQGSSPSWPHVRILRSICECILCKLRSGQCWSGCLLFLPMHRTSHILFSRYLSWTCWLAILLMPCLGYCQGQA